VWHIILTHWFPFPVTGEAKPDSTVHRGNHLVVGSSTLTPVAPPSTSTCRKSLWSFSAKWASTVPSALIQRHCRRSQLHCRSLPARSSEIWWSVPTPLCSLHPTLRVEPILVPTGERNAVRRGRCQASVVFGRQDPVHPPLCEPPYFCDVIGQAHFLGFQPSNKCLNVFQILKTHQK
jgi:hypothetical protein